MWVLYIRVASDFTLHPRSSGRKRGTAKLKTLIVGGGSGNEMVEEMEQHHPLAGCPTYFQIPKHLLFYHNLTYLIGGNSFIIK